MSEPYCSDELRLTKAHVRHKNIAMSLNLLSSEGARRIHIMSITSLLKVSSTHYANLTSNSGILTGASVNINLGGGGFISVSV